MLPLAAKIKRVSELEAAQMELVVEGIAEIQAGSNPRLVAQKLAALLPPEPRRPRRPHERRAT